jgi:hypothetical protein
MILSYLGQNTYHHRPRTLRIASWALWSCKIPVYNVTNAHPNKDSGKKRNFM